MDKITTTLVVLGATVLGMYNCIQIVELMNKKRDLVLDINKDGKLLTKDQKKLLLWNDYAPLMGGVLIFPGIYTAAFYELPGILDEKFAAIAASGGAADPI